MDLRDSGDDYEPEFFDQLVVDLSKHDGDPRFLAFLRNFPPPSLTKPAKPGHDQRYWDARRRTILQLCKELTEYYPTISAEELDALRFIADKMLVLQAFEKAVPGAMFGIKRGAPIKRPELYFWFAVLAPYTLFATGSIRWAWIGRWINMATKQIMGKPESYWKDVIQPKAEGKDLPLQMRAIFLSGVNVYRQWLREGKPTIVRHPKSPAIQPKVVTVFELKKRLEIWKAAPSKEERKYIEVALQLFPALRDQLQRRYEAKVGS